MALRNTGSYGRVILDQTTWAFNSDTTYCCWIDLQNANHLGCIYDILDDPNTKIVQFGVRAGKIGIFKYGGSAMVQKAYSINTRYFVSVKMQGTSLKIRFNNTGEVSATDTRPSGNWSAATPPSMFSNFYGDNLQGQIRDFRYYNRILSDDEIDTIYRCTGKDAICTGLQNRLTFIGRTGYSLNSYSDLKNETKKAVTISGDGTPGDLVYYTSFLESKVIN